MIETYHFMGFTPPPFGNQAEGVALGPHEFTPLKTAVPAALHSYIWCVLSAVHNSAKTASYFIPFPYCHHFESAQADQYSAYFKD